MNLDPRLRKSAEQIYQKILPYEYNIKNLIAFVPNVNPIIHGSKSVVSSYNNTLPGFKGSGFGTSNIPDVGFTQSIYENRNIVQHPQNVQIQNSPNIL